MSKKKESKEPINKKVLITNIVLWTLGVAAVLIVLFWDSIFTGEGQQIFKGNNGFAAMGEWFANNLHVLIYTVVVIAISLLIIALLNLGANKLRLKNKKAALLIYEIVAIVFIFLGSLLSNDLVWELTDFFNYLMVLPNAIALIALGPLVASAAKEGEAAWKSQKVNKN